MAVKKLTTRIIKASGDGLLHDGNGLRMKKKGDRGYWSFRRQIDGTVREIALGVWPDVAIAEARARAQAASRRMDGEFPKSDEMFLDFARRY